MQILKIAGGVFISPATIRDEQIPCLIASLAHYQATGTVDGVMVGVAKDEEITIAQAAKVAQEHGHHITRRAILNAAREGRIVGARQIDNYLWTFSDSAFRSWLASRRRDRKNREKNPTQKDNRYVQSRRNL
jgi:hypothetical protein